MSGDDAALLIGLSVLMHVSWNLLARSVDQQANYLWWGLLAHLLLLGPWAFGRLWLDAQWSPELLLALLTTAAANSLYFLALRHAYRQAPVALVYPLARSSPILIALWAWWLFGEALPAGAWLGIAVSIAGLWILAASCDGKGSRSALLWAAVAAVGTSIYSLSDKVAVAYLPSFGAQLGFISVGYAASFALLTLAQWRETGRAVPPKRPGLLQILIGGLFIGTAYALVVRAMLHLPAAYVVSYTNAGIVLATLLSILVFGERSHWQRRLLAAVVISLGLVVLGISRA